MTRSPRENPTGGLFASVPRSDLIRLATPPDVGLVFDDDAGSTLTVHEGGVIEVRDQDGDVALFAADETTLPGIIEAVSALAAHLGIGGRAPRRKGYNGTGVPCRAADLEGRVGERLEIAVYDNVTAGKTSTVTGVLDSVDDLIVMVSPLWSPWQVSINVHDIANVWTAEPR